MPTSRDSYAPGLPLRILVWTSYHRIPLCQICILNKYILRRSCRLCYWLSLGCRCPRLNTFLLYISSLVGNLVLNNSSSVWNGGNGYFIVFASVYTLIYFYVYLNISTHINTLFLVLVFLPQIVFHLCQAPLQALFVIDLVLYLLILKLTHHQLLINLSVILIECSNFLCPTCVIYVKIMYGTQNPFSSMASLMV